MSIKEIIKQPKRLKVVFHNETDRNIFFFALPKYVKPVAGPQAYPNTNIAYPAVYINFESTDTAEKRIAAFNRVLQVFA